MKRLISLIICLILIFSCSVSVWAQSTKEESGNYPYIFIPGMVGWGTEYPGYDKFPYWGGGFTIGQ